MTTPYRTTPDGPFTVSVTLDATAHETLRRAWRGRGLVWLVVLGPPLVTTLSLVASGPPAQLPIAAGLAVLCHVGFVVLGWRAIARRAAEARTTTARDLEVTIAENGIDIAGDGGHRHWDWSHVASVWLDPSALVLFDPYDQAVVIARASHPALDKIAAYARARATGRRDRTARGLGIVALTHATLVAVALAMPRTPPPSTARDIANDARGAVTPPVSDAPSGRESAASRRPGHAGRANAEPR